MSMPITILAADPIDLAALEPLDGPKMPAPWSRAADQRDARQQIDEGYLAWLHGRAV